uniref:SPRY-associated domain-containing protein n=1 Tax=Cyprinus carpio TaxID=7962 RepID=A0A8C1X0R8_CYPCA
VINTRLLGYSLFHLNMKALCKVLYKGHESKFIIIICVGFTLDHYMNVRITASVDCVSSAPVILDPNMAHPGLILSDDLTKIFNWYPCVLGSEGFNSGTHCWDVEVKQSEYWSLGVTTASNQRKGYVFFDTDVWSVNYDEERWSEPFGFHVDQDIDRVRVYLDYDRGTVSFSDPTHIHNTLHLHTLSSFPLFFLSEDLNDQ